MNIENELVTVGGDNKEGNWFGQQVDLSKVYTYSQEKWVEKYSPKPTKRWECSSVYMNSVLIVAGGVSGNSTHITTVEMLNIHSKQWSKVNSLPTPISFSSASIYLSICLSGIAYCKGQGYDIRNYYYRS